MANYNSKIIYSCDFARLTVVYFIADELFLLLFYYHYITYIGPIQCQFMLRIWLCYAWMNGKKLLLWFLLLLLL